MGRRWLVLVVLGLVPLPGAACLGTGSLDEARAAEIVRELPLLADVKVEEVSRAEFARQAEEAAEAVSDEYLAYLADTYGRLGFFSRDLDLRPVLARSSSEWVGATYSPREQKITLVGPVFSDTVVHEWVHALQDQHFDLVAYDDLETSDAFLARRAVVEGDATLAQYRFLARQDGVELHRIDWARVLTFWQDYSRSVLEQAPYPPVFLDYLSFVYPFGIAYAAQNLLGASIDQPAAPPPPHDWRLQDQLFSARAPGTTREILELEVSGPAEPVVDLGLEAVPQELADRLAPIDWDRLGVWYVYLLLLPLDLAGEIDARVLASGWAGDRVLFVRDRDSGEAGLVWASAWRDEESAVAIAGALAALHGRRPLKGEPPELGIAGDGELLWIERRGDRLVLAKNLDREVAEAAAAEALAGAGPAATRRLPSLGPALERLRGRSSSTLRNHREISCESALPSGLRARLWEN
jgi:hypothetical protein